MKINFNFGFIYAEQLYRLYMQGEISVTEREEILIVEQYGDSKEFNEYFADSYKCSDIKRI